MLNAFYSILLNSFLSQEPNYIETLEITKFIHRWQHRYIISLKILSNPRSANEQMGNIVGDEIGFTTTIGRFLKKLFPEWDDYQIERT